MGNSFRLASIRALGWTVLACLVFAVSTPLRAQPIRVLTFDPARAGMCDGYTLDFATSPTVANIRSALLNPANFGPGGVVSRSIVLNPPVFQLSPAALGSADVVLISTIGPPVPGQPDMSAIEQSLVAEFVSQGGGLLALWNDAAQQLAAQFGATASPVFGDVSCDSTVTLAAPVVGPFGSGAGCVAQNFRGFFATLGSGTAIISNGVGATFALGAGRAVFVNDEEWYWNGGGSPCGIPSLNTSKQRLFLNSVTFVVPSVPCFAFKTITSNPTDASTCAQGTATFSVAVGGAGPFAYEWQIELSSGVWQSLGSNPVPISCGPDALAFATPINSPTVSIGVRNCPGPFRVRCIVSNACGHITSTPATLTISTCPGDADADFTVGLADIAAIINCWSMPASCNVCADLDNSGSIGLGDIARVIGSWGSSCP